MYLSLECFCDDLHCEIYIHHRWQHVRGDLFSDIQNERLTCFAITSSLGPHGCMMAVEVGFVCNGES